MIINNGVLKKVFNTDILDGVFQVPSCVTSIGNCAFRGCTGLTKIEIPAGVTRIGDGAFEGCTSLAGTHQ